jgi:hypothetical protein
MHNAKSLSSEANDDCIHVCMYLSFNIIKTITSLISYSIKCNIHLICQHSHFDIKVIYANLFKHQTSNHSPLNVHIL